MNKLRIFSIIAFLILYFSGFSQTDFRAGYIITTTGDSINGLIDYQNDDQMNLVCRFKVNDTISTFYPEEISAYAFTNTKRYYISKKLKQSSYFFDVLIDGRLSLYKTSNTTGDHYYLNKYGTGFVEIPYTEEQVTKNDKTFLQKSTRHIGILKLFTEEVPDLINEIESSTTPDVYSLTDICKKYNDIVCKDEKCVVYEKEAPKVKLYPDIVGGIAFYSNTDDLLKQTTSQFGVIGHIWIPNPSEKIFVRTGLIYTRMAFYNNIKASYIKLPIQIEYLYPKGIIRPGLAIGATIYNFNYQTISLNGGLNFELTHNFRLTVNGDVEFTQTFGIIPKKYFGSVINAGIGYRF